MERTYPVIKVSTGLSVVVDESFRDPSKLIKKDAILFTPSEGDRKVYFYDDNDGYGMGAYNMQGVRYTLAFSRTCKIIFTIYGTLEGVPRIEIMDTDSKEFIDTFYQGWIKDTKRSGSVLIGPSIKELLSEFYKASQAKGCYTGEQVRKAIEMAQQSEEINCLGRCDTYSMNEIMSYLQQPKEIESVTLSTFKYPDGNYGFNEDIRIRDGKIIPVKINYK